MAEIRVNATGELKLYDSDDSNYVSFKSGGTVSSDVTWTLPTADGSNGQALTTNGSGTLSWADAGSADPSSADGDSLGTASAEWSDLYLADGGIIYLGNDQDIRLTHNADKGLIIKHSATADDKPVILTLQTGETDMAANDVIGKIEFQAPDEGTGTDAILVSGAIHAVAEGDHSSSSNATRLEFMTGASEAATSQMTVSSGGIVGVGAGVPGDLGVGLHVKSGDSGASVHGDADELVIEGASGHVGMTFLSTGSNKQTINFGDDVDNNIGQIEYDHSGNVMKFVTDAGERMRIDSDGHMGINFSSAHDNAIKVENITDSEWVISMRHTDSDNPLGMQIYYSGGAPDGSGDKFIRCLDTGAERFHVLSDGDVGSHDNSFGGVSDQRIKQNITDASSQWDDIKAVKVRKFKMKDDVRQYGDDAWDLLGVVAQELEASNMDKLVKEIDPSSSDILSDSSFGTLYQDGDDLPKGREVGEVKTVNAKVKHVKYSILYMKAIKALQEAMAKIESLEARVTTLEG